MLIFFIGLRIVHQTVYMRTLSVTLSIHPPSARWNLPEPYLCGCSENQLKQILVILQLCSHAFILCGLRKPFSVLSLYSRILHLSIYNTRVYIHKILLMYIYKGWYHLYIPCNGNGSFDLRRSCTGTRSHGIRCCTFYLRANKTTYTSTYIEWLECATRLVASPKIWRKWFPNEANLILRACFKYIGWCM